MSVQPGFSGQGSFRNIAPLPQDAGAISHKRTRDEDPEEFPNKKKQRRPAAYCPVCHRRFSGTTSRKQHVGIRKCIDTAAARGLTVPPSLEDLKKSSQLFSHLQDSSERFEAAETNNKAPRATKSPLVAGHSDHGPATAALCSSRSVPPLQSRGLDSDALTSQRSFDGTIMSGSLFLAQPSRTPGQHPFGTPAALQRSISYPLPLHQQQSMLSSAHPVQFSRSTSWIHPQHVYRKDSQLQGSVSFGDIDAASARQSYETSGNPVFSAHQPRSYAATIDLMANARYRQRMKDILTQPLPLIPLVPSQATQSVTPSVHSSGAPRGHPEPAQAGPSLTQHPPSPRHAPVPPPRKIQRSASGWSVYGPGNGGATRIPTPTAVRPPRSQSCGALKAGAQTAKEGKMRARSETAEFEFESIAFMPRAGASEQTSDDLDQILSTMIQEASASPSSDGQGSDALLMQSGTDEFLDAILEEAYASLGTDAQGSHTQPMQFGTDEFPSGMPFLFTAHDIGAEEPAADDEELIKSWAWNALGPSQRSQLGGPWYQPGGWAASDSVGL
ncbi:hypothetical protein B0H11DRAFT_2233062 [Mycena galericulata]|nr:hypothetical protein B0H11DRAFT_2233062 [Mycena galericulata]